MSNQTTSRKKISIHDIARQLNVSSTTVSFVLNGKAEEKRISDEMKKKILDHVAEVGYQPNQVAKSLRSGKSKIIGMLVEDISDPFFSCIFCNLLNLNNIVFFFFLVCYLVHIINGLHRNLRHHPL